VINAASAASALRRGSAGPKNVGLEKATANSLSCAFWVVVSRVTGLGKVAAIGAVLGPTYLGNTFQATNLLPNLMYGLLTGSLLASLLVPPLVRLIDLKDGRADRLAGGFLGVTTLAFGAVTALAILAGPALLHVFTLGVDEPGVAADQHRVGWPLLAMLMPQVILYGIAGTGAAVMNAHGRFALAAAAPVLENIGVMATLGAAALVFGTGTDLENVTTPQLLVLGLGTTAAVGLHAGAQWLGAWRVGVRLIPRAGWRDPEVREIIQRAVPSLGYTGLNALRVFAVLVVANRIPGGVVAFLLALNLFYLPVAVAGEPIAITLLPRLSRLYHEQKRRLFHDEFVKGLSLALFFTVPSAVACAVLSVPFAQAVSFGELGTAAGVTLIAASLAALAAGVPAEASFLMARNASYALHDARAPFRSMILRTSVSLSGMLIAFLFMEGTAMLVTLGLAMSAGNIASAWHLARRLRSKLPKSSERLAPPLLRGFVASALMAAPAYFVAAHVPDLIGGELSDVVGMLAAGLVSIVTFVGVQRAFRSPELALIFGGFRHLGSENRS
jgi:putative peptidoglycan lipid II flippase